MCSVDPDRKKIVVDATDKPAIENENTKLNEWRESTKAILGLPAHPKPFSISNVPQELLEGNYKNAYMPKTISIGPRYKGTRKNLLQMQNTKWTYMQSLLHRGPKKTAETALEQCKQVVWGLENVVRASYADEDLQLEWNDLADILLFDACFLLELLISRSKEMKEEELTDLLVLENQIPLVILHRLCERIFDEVGVVAVVPVETLVLNLFGYYPHKRFKYFTPNFASHHFLELVHSYVSEDSEEMEKVPGVQPHVCIHCPNFQIVSHCVGCASADMPDGMMLKAMQTIPNRCARILEAAGVKIVIPGMDDVVNKGQIRDFNINIKFDRSNGTLEIPQLHITETTEVLWRNLIAWEQGHAGFSCKHKCTWAAFFFNDLICQESDVQLLKDRRVIVVGVVDDHHDSNMSNQQLLEFFRSMVKGIDGGKVNDSVYWNMVHNLNEYSATNYYAKQFPVILWHSWLPQAIPGIFKFLRRGYNLMLAAISILSVLQTYYTILSYYHPKK